MGLKQLLLTTAKKMGENKNFKERLIFEVLFAYVCLFYSMLGFLTFL